MVINVLHAGQEILHRTLAQACVHIQDFVGVKRRMQLLCGCSGSHLLKSLTNIAPMASSVRACSAGSHVHVYDDYAHHPTEIAATLSAVREKHASAAVIAVWQPISRGRLSKFMHQFCTELQPAAHVIIAPIDTSREAVDADADARLVSEVCARLNHSERNAQGHTDRAFAAHEVESVLRFIQRCACCTWQGSPGTDIAVLFMGSGDITHSACTLSDLLS